MNLFEVYKLWDIEPVKGLDTTLWDKNGEVYTDLYGGHAVISIGHSHPHYVKMLSEQLGNLGFYSNAVQNSLQKDLATRLGRLCGYDDYALFGYALKLKLLERKTVFNAEKGKAELDKLVKSLEEQITKIN